ncbi:MAG: SDR family NAD(P)-dependent oxidoreductase [Actinobacteria bacterium]|uniref:Unannotated protein n=1 Tax=freshwater metagenome TaxID=449393 RepID=A0A6J5YWA8_9ZZZZ|nr:SDR family NAD(P)-dependent oxidoreductase [Actinomycetota bacterium]
MTTEKVILITGASTGIGAATARAAAALGHKLVLAARSTEALERVAEECGGPGQAIAVTTDVTSWEANEALAAAAINEFGRIDVSFVNAGFGGKGGFGRDGAHHDHWREMVLTNVLGAAFTVRATFDAIKESRGHYLLTSSVAGRVAIPGSFYSSTKWAVTGMAQSLRAELVGSGARVTLIEPGVVDTPFWDNGSPMADGLTDDDIARSVMFAISQPAHVDINELLIRPTSQGI